MKFLTLVLLLLISFPSPAADKAEAPLLKADRDFAQATAKNRLEGWMSYMADEAVLLNPAKPVVGKDAIREFYKQAFADPSFELTWTPTRGEMFASGDMGYTSGRYQMLFKNAKGEAVVSKGNYLTVWRKQKDGSWKVVGDGGAPEKK